MWFHYHPWHSFGIAYCLVEPQVEDISYAQRTTKDQARTHGLAYVYDNVFSGIRQQLYTFHHKCAILFLDLKVDRPFAAEAQAR
jgi:hypothetical protein